jgi:hypothetical protein
VLIGGHDNFANDRAMAEELTRLCPGVADLARGNRGFIDRAVTWAAGQGVIQFADLGAGLPMPSAPGAGLREIHQAARVVNPSARAAYVDNDYVAVLHSRVARRLSGAARTWPTLKMWKVSRSSRPTCATPGRSSQIPACSGSSTRRSPCPSSSAGLSLFLAAEAREIVSGYADLAAPGSLFGPYLRQGG